MPRIGIPLRCLASGGNRVGNRRETKEEGRETSAVGIVELRARRDVYDDINARG